MTVKMNLWEEENHPYYFATFADDPEYGEHHRFYPNVELSDDEAADLRRVRAEHAAWQEKLAEMFTVWHEGRKP